MSDLDDGTFIDPEFVRMMAEADRRIDGEIHNLDDLAELDIAAANLDLAETNDPRTRSSDRFQEGHRRRIAVITALRSGASVKEALAAVNVTYTAYQKWRTRYPRFRAQADEAKLIAASNTDGEIQWSGSRALFHLKYFGHRMAWFQLHVVDRMCTMPRGNILMALFAPEHGKTTTFEDHASAQLALEPSWRFFLVSESRDISVKILDRVKQRMDPMGPTPQYVADFGPFMPQPGQSRSSQPWSKYYFTVHKASSFDERDYSMRAVGVGSKQTVSTRTDHAHMDDLQSVRSLSEQQTNQTEAYVRQDVFTRPGEKGISTIFGTRVGDDDVYERLENDPELDSSVMEVVKLPAIITDHDTNTVRPLWPEMYSMVELARMKKKAGPEAWDRNYMQKPGLSSKGKRTFTVDMIEPCRDPLLSLQHHRAAPGSIVYIGLDPSIGGKNCVLAVEVTTDGKLIVRRIQETTGLYTNGQVIGQVKQVIDYVCADGARCTDVVVEEMAFQKGLLEDENMQELQREYRLSVSGHKTGWNKYDADIGLPSMAESFRRREIVLPWADDDYTRATTGQLETQLKAWKPFVRGNRLRQDQVMALWFTWILWRGRWKQPVQRDDTIDVAFQTRGLPYATTETGLWLPRSAR